MTLSDEIAERRASIHTDGYPMSVGELINLYRDRELDIHPEFQRFFRWTENQKSRLVESLLLGIPIPSIFVAQRQDGVWDVIDGLQRLSTIFQLTGVLRDENEEIVEPLRLAGTKYLPSLHDMRWGEDENEADGTLNREQKLLIKRSKIDVKIILRESDDSSKYELFQRLNTGGSPLSDQEVRNCILITVNRDFYRRVENLAKSETFQQCIALTDRLREEQYDLELVVRFLVLRNATDPELRDIGDIGEFLTDKAVARAQDESFDFDSEEEAFRRTFDAIYQALGENAFRRFDSDKERFLGSFLLSAFEYLAIGVGANYERFVDGRGKDLKAASAKSIWSDADFARRIGSGIRGSLRIPVTVRMGRSAFGGDTA